ncbi:MAG: hypothetical protein O2955_20410, partial [Planctomycetota bacterium]|nr:hypothetical protein [Planctomycetota bacterium]
MPWRLHTSNSVLLSIATLTLVIMISDVDARGADPYSQIDPYWLLLHEPAVVEELQLTDKQFDAYQELLGELDLLFFPVRNKARDDAVAGLEKVVDQARRRLPAILQPSQLRRLNEILMWRLGTSALTQDDVAAKLQLDDSQRKRVQEIIEKIQVDVTAIEKEVSEGKPRAPLERKYTDLKTKEQKQIIRVLKTEQVDRWKKMLGTTFDVTQLGNTRFKAPPLVDTGEWMNSRPLALEELRGKVVVLHFYASGCINCIHNY